MIKKATLVFLLSVCIIMSSCTKDKGPIPDPIPAVSDEEFYQEFVQTTGYTYYKSGRVLLPKGNSPHGSFKLRLNSIANAILNADGSLPDGATFPTGSIIVKEIYLDGVLDLYAVMKKEPASVLSKDGWIWSENEVDGRAIYSVNTKGSACTPCHNGGNNEDLTQTFNLH